MFEAKQETHSVSGQTFTIREFSASEFFNLPEDPFEVVALAWVSPGNVTIEQVSKWPGSIVLEITELISKLNTISGNSPSETLPTTE